MAMPFRLSNKMKIYLGLLVAVYSVGATAEMPFCPPTLTTAVTPQIQPGFTAFVDGNPPIPAATESKKNTLTRIMFSEGAPDRQAWLSPDTETQKTQSWSFASNHDENVWITCAYANTALITSKPISGIVSCSVTSGKLPVLVCKQ